MPSDHPTFPYRFISVSSSNSSSHRPPRYRFIRSQPGRKKNKYSSTQITLEATMAGKRDIRDESPTKRMAAQVKKAKKKLEDDAVTDARITKLIEQTNAKIGGRVNEGKTKEENADLLNHFVAEMYREDPNDWPMLKEGQEFIKQMGKSNFALVGSVDEDDADDDRTVNLRSRTLDAPMEGQPRRGRRKPDQAKEDEQLNRVEDGEQPTPLAKDRPVMTKETKAAAMKEQKTATVKQQTTTAVTRETTTTVTREETRPPTPAPLSPARKPRETPASSAEPRRKKRRMDDLSTNFGSAWDAHVDEQGHRPGRSSRKNQ
ncbi:hypothetical protein GGR52DRAFT_527111 [Hypoxylon sp. FL1284]|nr:hypothetical protein GGR52DRAFT_527111 [Hypoxylon sp. FL1284]